MGDAHIASRSVVDLPLYGGQTASSSKSFRDYVNTDLISGSSIVRSLSLLSFFRSSRPHLDQRLLLPLESLPIDPLPTTKHVHKAIDAFQQYLGNLTACLRQTGATTTHITLDVARAMEAYANAFKVAAAIAWCEPGDVTVARTLEASLKGAVRLYGFLSSLPPEVIDDVAQIKIDKMGKIILATAFGGVSADTIGHLAPLFARCRSLVSSLQTTFRPMAHFKGIRGSPPPNNHVTEGEALEAVSLLETLVDELAEVHRLPGPRPSKTKAQKEEDVRRPLRLAIEARVMSCDVMMSMANRDIDSIKRRAHLAMPDNADQPTSNRSSATEWEVMGEAALIRCLEVAVELVTERRGGVLSDKVEMADWLGEGAAVPMAQHAPERESAKMDDNDAPDSDDSDEDDSDEDEDAIDTYACPLRALFRLHDRYEEQRLAVWLSLPAASRVSMGTYMRGTGGKMGRAWDNLGLVLLLDYDT